MNDFNKLCKEFESIDFVSYSAILAEKSIKIVPALMAITDDGLNGAEIFAAFIMGAITADGKLSEEEYMLLYPALHLFLGDNVNYEDAKKAVKSLRHESKELGKIVDQMVDVIGLLSEEMKNDIIIVMMLICAVDGKISLREKSWIKRLIK